MCNKVKGVNLIILFPSPIQESAVPCKRMPRRSAWGSGDRILIQYLEEEAKQH